MLELSPMKVKSLEGKGDDKVKAEGRTDERSLSCLLHLWLSEDLARISHCGGNYLAVHAVSSLQLLAIISRRYIFTFGMTQVQDSWSLSP